MSNRNRGRKKVTRVDKPSSAHPPRHSGETAADGNASAKKTEPMPVKSNERLSELIASNRQLKRKIFDLYTVFEISRNFNSVLNYQNLLDSFILTSLAQVSASKAAIFLRENPQSNHYVMAKGKGSGPFPEPDQFIDGKGELALFLTRLNRPVVVDELINDTANENEKKIMAAFHPGLAVPMIFQARLTGILLISEKFAANEFNSDDTEFLSILANQISVAIENARLYEAEKEATQQLRAAQQQLINTERLAALGEMSARVAHEINNPLGIIKNYLLLLRRAMGRNVEAGNYAEIVKQEIDRIARIVRQLLDFHRPVKNDFSPVDAVSILEEVLELMSRQLKKLDIELVTILPAERLSFVGSSENIKQVFLNIIINACDAMPNGGKLEIELVTIGSELTISFFDTGTGISAEIIPRIFEPFFTTKQAGKGTGLGLSVCYGIIKRHGGSITYRNTKEGGCFEIKLPILRNGPGNEQDS